MNISKSGSKKWFKAHIRAALASRARGTPLNTSIPTRGGRARVWDCRDVIRHLKKLEVIQ